MRFLVIALMIVLLPLRSWAGDAMATQMAGSQIAIESGAANAHETSATATFDHQKQAKSDCHEATPSPLDSHPSASHEPGSNHCGNCVACQACHTVALLPALLKVPAELSSPQLQPARTVFTSAATALGQKPPIS